MKKTINIPLYIKVLLGSAFLMNAGTFMVIPFLVVYLSMNLEFNPWQVGTVLSANLFLGRLLPFFTGLIGDKFSHRVTLIFGILIRGFGFIGYGFFDTFSGLLLASAMVGIGGALYDPSIMTIFANQKPEERKKSLTFLNQSLNAGAVLGPMFAAGLLFFNPTIPFLISGLILILIAITLMYKLESIETTKSSTNLLESIKQILGNKAYIKYLLVMMLYWIAFSQLSVSIPLYVYNLTGDSKLISTVYIVNGISGLLFMFFLRQLFINHQALSLIKIGLLITSVSLIALPLFMNIPWLLLVIIVFTLGETLILPSSDIAIADFSNEKNTGGYYGLFELSFAGGTIIGTYMGILLVNQNSIYPWLIYGIVCLIAFVLIQLLLSNNQTLKDNKGNLEATYENENIK